MGNRTPYQDTDTYYDYNGVICPMCGGRIKHPYTGEVTSEQIDEDINTCLWMEVIDEDDITLGWTPICKNIHPYTLEEEEHVYVHYDMLELINNEDSSVSEKIDEVTTYILKFYPDVNKEDIIFSVRENKLTEVYVNGIEDLTLDLSLDEEGNVIVTPV